LKEKKKRSIKGQITGCDALQKKRRGREGGRLSRKKRGTSA